MLFTWPCSNIFDTMFSKVNRGFPVLSRSYRSLFHHKSFFHPFDVSKPAEHVLLHSHCDILVILPFCVSLYCGFDQLSWLRISYEVIAEFIFLSFFFYNTHVSLPFNSVDTNTVLCTAKRAAVLTFRRLINAVKAPLILLPAAIRLSTSISSEHTSQIYHFIYLF